MLRRNSLGNLSGQHATITNNGRINTQPIQIPEGGTFYIDNQYMPCYIGLNQKLNGVFAPAFLDQYLNIFGPSDITPLVTVMVFFSRTLETSSMFLNVSSSVCEIAYQGAVQKAVEYTDVKGNGNGMWVKNTSAGFAPAPLCSYSFGEGFKLLSEAYDPFAVAALVDKFKTTHNDGQVTLSCPVWANTEFGDSECAQSTGEDFELIQFCQASKRRIVKPGSMW